MNSEIFYFKIQEGKTKAIVKINLRRNEIHFNYYVYDGRFGGKFKDFSEDFIYRFEQKIYKFVIGNLYNRRKECLKF